MVLILSRFFQEHALNVDRLPSAAPQPLRLALALSTMQNRNATGQEARVFESVLTAVAEQCQTPPN